MSFSSICGLPLAEAALEANFCAHVIPVELNRPRSIISVTKDEFLVFNRGTSGVLRAFDTDGDGIPDQTESIGANGGNHGMAYLDGYIYISSDSTVWRWRYDLGDSSVAPSSREIVVVNIDEDGQGGAPNGHTTRTLAFDEEGRLYISVGSVGNVDSDSHRSRIRRLDISGGIEDFPLDFQDAEVFADGLRNEVGLAFDKYGVLWGVENGADNLYRSDMGGDIHNDNPAEELNRFPESLAGSDWGYPECWSEYLLPDSVGRGPGTQWSWPGFPTTDAECRNNRVASELAMQAHSAPLGITFYNYTSTHPEGCSGAFPESMDGDAFIAFHGSWNRDIPTGYKVVYVKMTEDGMVDPSFANPIDLLARDSSTTARWTSGYRPVDVDFDECGRLLVTSDGTYGRGSNVVRIAYGDVGCCVSTSSAPSQAPSTTPQPTLSPPSCPEDGNDTFFAKRRTGSRLRTCSWLSSRGAPGNIKKFCFQGEWGSGRPPAGRVCVETCAEWEQWRRFDLNDYQSRKCLWLRKQDQARKDRVCRINGQAKRRCHITCGFCPW